jgi:hypothetical protein
MECHRPPIFGQANGFTSSVYRNKRWSFFIFMGLRLAALGGVAARFVPQAQAAHVPQLTSVRPRRKRRVCALARALFHIARPIAPAWNQALFCLIYGHFFFSFVVEF